jgi:FkbH-like protein
MEVSNTDGLSLDDLLLHRKRLSRELSKRPDLTDVRIAVLGGTTTNELVDFLEVLLLECGFRASFYQSEFGRYYEDAVLEPEKIAAFNPNLVYVHTCWRNIRSFPPVSCMEEQFDSCIQAELGRFREIWRSLGDAIGCQVVQNNFDLPPHLPLGNLEVVSTGGSARFIQELNRAFAAEVRQDKRLALQDLQGISARIGIERWADLERWFSYKLANSIEGTFALASSLAALVRATYGRTRKALVLDLDNTLWGGVIGDDGVDRIVIGRETPLGEAYTAFQEYCLSLRARGILLAVCSKNEDAIARSGFSHPDSVLKLEHFSAFKANWEPKHENIQAIARELNLMPDSFVFVDDNPAERAIVRAQIPGIAVPEVGTDVAGFASIIELKRYFETQSLGAEDLSRAALYEQNAARAGNEQKFANYGEYLDFLDMSAEIESFSTPYMDRIAQLTNKSNHFNLTTRRYTRAELDLLANDGKHITLYGKLSDRFGDNGLVSIILGRMDGRNLHLDLWLMSCRVLKRDMEMAMLDTIVARARSRGVNALIGYYLPTAKNGMVAEHYRNLGFERINKDETTGSSIWSLDLEHYQAQNRHIKTLEPVVNG